MVPPSAEELARFQEPERLYEKVIPESLGIKNAVFFNRSDSQYQKYREAWAASLFARGFSANVQPCKVRVLAKDSFPDLEVQVPQRTYSFELGEALNLERKRGDEYANKQGPPGKFASPVETADWISSEVKKKAAKRYNPPPNLLVYVNFLVADGFDLELVRGACRAYCGNFPSLWLLWVYSIVQLFPHRDFPNACENWTEIPGYREEVERKEGIRK